MKNKKLFIFLIIILIYIGLKVIVLYTPSPTDDNLPDVLLELITDVKINP